MRRDVGGHTYRNTGGTIDQKIGKTRRQHHRLLQVIVIVGHKIHRIFIDIGQHRHGNFAHSGFRISIRRRRISVYRAKVAMSVYQRIPHGKILCQAHHGIINRGVSVGMVPPQHRTDRIGRFSVCFVRRQSVFIHSIQNPTVYRL